MYTRYTEAEIARMACKNLRSEYQSQIRIEHMRGFAHLKEECRSITLRNRSIRNLRPPPKPETVVRPHLAYRSNITFRKRLHADAMKNVEEKEEDGDDVAAVYNHGRSSQVPPPNNNNSNSKSPALTQPKDDKYAELEVQIEKLKRNKREPSKNQVQEENKDIVCYRCKQPGRFAKECPQQGIVCYGCNTQNVIKQKFPKYNTRNEQ